MAANSDGRSFSYTVKAKSENVSGTIVSGKCRVLVVLNLVNVQERLSNVLVGFYDTGDIFWNVGNN